MAEGYEILDSLGPVDAAPSNAGINEPGGGDVLLTLGPVVFAARAGYETASRKSMWRWATLSRPGRGPAVQWIGPDADRITLEGTLYPARGGRGLVEALRRLADTGEAHELIGPDGATRGFWAVVSVHEASSRHLPGGGPLKVAWKCDLLNEDGPIRDSTASDLAYRAHAHGDVAAVTLAVERAVSDGQPPGSVRAAAAAAAGPGDATRRVVSAVDAAPDNGSAILDAALSAADRSVGAPPAPPPPATVAYRAQSGQTLAGIAARRYGVADAVIQLLDANPELARHPVLPSRGAGEIAGYRPGGGAVRERRRAGAVRLKWPARGGASRRRRRNWTPRSPNTAASSG